MEIVTSGATAGTTYLIATITADAAINAHTAPKAVSYTHLTLPTKLEV